MQKRQIDLSVIIINLSTDKYHTKKQLEIALKSMVPALQKVKYEVIVVDNSTIDDGTHEMSSRYIKNLVYLKRNSVFSFCNNNNYGLRQTNGRYVLFLNNDIKLLDDKIFEEMVEWMDINQQVAVTSPALLNNGQQTIQASGGSFPTLLRVIAWMTFLNNSYHHKLSYYNNEHSQDWVTGAFYLVRKDILDKIGAFDEDYEAYVEEVDLSYRIKSIGHEIVYLPRWQIIHFGGQSYGNNNSLILELKNIKLFYKKHYPAWQLPILNFVIKLGCILRIIVFGVFKPNLVNIYAKAIKSV
ncbi:MAG: hypothetical protein ACD_26C00034G0008 [uncultured bacterium]|nr:MAG: hypothetical protein ACD_26C00034G0008 [uncultured bacterium]